MTKVLSPLATPFAPSQEEPEDMFAIYNDGVPSLVGSGPNWEQMILHNISDEALDEAFPPTAEEAAEMEAAELFVETMVNLAMLEEMEEESRKNFVHIRKRWEARREEGLVGKPYPVAEGRHKNTHVKQADDETTLVPYDMPRKSLAICNLESRVRAKEEGKRRHDRAATKKLTGVRSHKPIQQPVKGR